MKNKKSSNHNNNNTNTNTNEYENELIEKKLDSIHNDVKKIMEKTNQEYISMMVDSFKSTYNESVSNYIEDNTGNSLKEKMVIDCSLFEEHYPIFKESILNINKNGVEKITKEDIERERAIIEQLRENARKEDCEKCFSSASKIFNNNIKLLNSLNIYNNGNNDVGSETGNNYIDFNEEYVFKEILEPLANVKRLKILKALANSPQTFSMMSEKTNLRGGSLIFHIQKLQENGLIIQKTEHGEYLLTKKGLNSLQLISNNSNFNKNLK
ncbi:MAG: winged helix-turn-helix domain-containing protein [Methanobacteriaceae archaeon]